MDSSKRLFLALAISIALIVGFRFLFPPSPVPPAAQKRADSAAVATPNAAPAGAAVGAVGAVGTATASSGVAGAPAAAAQVVRPETLVVAGPTSNGARFTMSSVGAVPTSVVLPAYENHARRGTPVDLSAGGRPLLKYHIVTNGSPQTDLSTVPFTAERVGDVVTYRASTAAADVAIRYTFVPDSYTVRVTGTLARAAANSYLVVDLPTTFGATESDTAADLKHFAYTYLSKRDGARNVPFASLDPGEREPVAGPLTWVAAKTKYFVVGVLAPVNGPRLLEAAFVGGTRTSKIATQAAASAVVPVQPNGTFAFDLYAGPQSLKRLQALGRDFHEVNPYGWAFLRGLLQPIATGVALLVLWMHDRLALSYGMVLVVLGVLVRVLTWPLNQKTMRTQVAMQRLQPELQAVQDKYKDDPEKQRAEIMKVYAAHGMNPLSPLLGCLPMLLPMPVLLALFFVFQSTVEFRGVSFLWLTDLSSHDPYYILPILMGLSMYALSWIGMRNTPPNPQAKMMSYAMPAMFLVFFFKIASGLNLYYAVQNLAALPQQWLVARERAKGTGPAAGSVAAAKSPVKPAGATKRG